MTPILYTMKNFVKSWPVLSWWKFFSDFSNHDCFI